MLVTLDFHVQEANTIQSSVSGFRITRRIGSPNGTLPKFPEQRSFQEGTDFDISYQCRMSVKFTVLFYL